MQNEKQVDLAGKQFENLSGKNHENLPKDLQDIQDEKKRHNWEQNENKHLVHGKDYNVDDMARKVPIHAQIQREVKHEGDLNWNQSQNQPWNVLQNNTQSIQEDKTSILQNQSREVPLNNEKGVPIHHKNPADNKEHKTREEAELKQTFGAPGPMCLDKCAEKQGISHGPAPGSQKQNLTEKDKHREQEALHHHKYDAQTLQKELPTKASKKDVNIPKDLQGPKWVEGQGKNEATIESKDKDFKSQRPIDSNLNTGYEKAETDVIKGARAQQDTAHGQ